MKSSSQLHVWRVQWVALLALMLALGTAGCNEISTAPAGMEQYEFAFAFGTEGPEDGQFRYVEDMAISASGDLYVTDAINSNIQVFSRDGKFRTSFGGPAAKDGGLKKPEGIAIAPDGSIFVADYLTGKVHKYTADHRLILSFSEFGTEDGQNAESEFMQICTNGLLYMAEAGNHRSSIRAVPFSFRSANRVLKLASSFDPKPPSAIARAMSTSPISTTIAYRSLTQWGNTSGPSG